MSDLLSSLFFRSFAHKKTGDSLEKPKSEFPTLNIYIYILYTHTHTHTHTPPHPHTPTHTHPHTHTVYIIKLLKKALKAYSNYDYMYVQGDSGGPLYMSEFHPTTNLIVPGGKW